MASSGRSFCKLFSSPNWPGRLPIAVCLPSSCEHSDRSRLDQSLQKFKELEGALILFFVYLLEVTFQSLSSETFRTRCVPQSGWHRSKFAVDLVPIFLRFFFGYSSFLAENFRTESVQNNGPDSESWSLSKSSRSECRSFVIPCVHHRRASIHCALTRSVHSSARWLSTRWAPTPWIILGALIIRNHWKVIRNSTKFKSDSGTSSNWTLFAIIRIISLWTDAHLRFDPVHTIALTEYTPSVKVLHPDVVLNLLRNRFDLCYFRPVITLDFRVCHTSSFTLFNHRQQPVTATILQNHRNTLRNYHSPHQCPSANFIGIPCSSLSRNDLNSHVLSSIGNYPFHTVNNPQSFYCFIAARNAVRTSGILLWQYCSYLRIQIQRLKFIPFDA